MEHGSHSWQASLSPASRTAHANHRLFCVQKPWRRLRDVPIRCQEDAIAWLDLEASAAGESAEGREEAAPHSKAEAGKAQRRAVVIVNRDHRMNVPRKKCRPLRRCNGIVNEREVPHGQRPIMTFDVPRTRRVACGMIVVAANQDHLEGMVDGAPIVNGSHGLRLPASPRVNEITKDEKTLRACSHNESIDDGERGLRRPVGYWNPPCSKGGGLPEMNIREDERILALPK
jgi:hypothetical protein